MVSWGQWVGRVYWELVEGVRGLYHEGVVRASLLRVM